MNCSKCTEKLTALICEELSHDDELVIHEHLSTCESCREEYICQSEAYYSLHDLLAPTQSISLDEAHLNIVHAEASRLDKLSSSNKGSIKFPAWILTLAACLVVFFLWQQLQNPPLSTNTAKLGKNEQAESSSQSLKDESVKRQAPTDNQSKLRKTSFKNDRALHSAEVNKVKEKEKLLELEEDMVEKMEEQKSSAQIATKGLRRSRNTLKKQKPAKASKTGIDPSKESKLEGSRSASALIMNDQDDELSENPKDVIHSKKKMTSKNKLTADHFKLLLTDWLASNKAIEQSQKLQLQRILQHKNEHIQLHFVDAKWLLRLQEPSTAEAGAVELEQNSEKKSDETFLSFSIQDGKITALKLNDKAKKTDK